MIDITPVPNRLTRPDTLEDDADSFFGKLPQFGADLIALQGNLNSIAAGGAYAIPYTFDTATANSDPGAGKLRLSSASQSSTTQIYLDATAADSKDYTTVIDGFDASTSAVMGSIRLVKLGDASKFLTFDVTALTWPTGFVRINVNPTGSSSANPFVNGDAVMLFFQRTGDKGDTGTLSAKFSERQAQGTQGGTSSSAGVQTRVLNTVEYNEIGATLSSNQIVLQPGTYDFFARAPAFNSGSGRAYLYNVTDSTSVQGANAYTNPTGSVQTDAVVAGRTVVPAGTTKTYQLRHYTGSGQTTNGLGVAANKSGEQEIYSVITFTKVL